MLVIFRIHLISSELSPLTINMCYYCMYPYGAYPQAYPTYQYYGYPAENFYYPNYALPLVYAYPQPAPPTYFYAAPGLPRGEHKAGNCLMICQ